LSKNKGDIVVFQPTLESLRQHAVPDWFHDAKLGIFIHWGLYSVPGWAPPGGDIDQQVRDHGWSAMFANNPYSEWYLNTYRLGDTPTRRHHVATYGKNFSYDDFAPMFNQAVENWDAGSWASLFQRIGARYVVLTTKHHDGFLLWNSQRTSPHKPGSFAARRDLVGELTNAVRQRGMRMGLYYSGGLDWSFEQRPVTDFIDVYATIVQTPEFVDYADFHWRELIDRYAPSILWNDIGYPANANVLGLFAHYYNRIPDGLVNDRWSQTLPDAVPGAGEPIGPPPSLHCDYTTPEYGSYREIVARKWEACRGIGHSFGYNQNEGEDDYLSVAQLVHLLVDIVSKNGNLLLDVGPMADGTIPQLQVERLDGLGVWLDVNSEAIFGTRPWQTAESTTDSGLGVRFTRRDNALYAVLLGAPGAEWVRVRGLRAVEGTTVSLLGREEALEWAQDGESLAVRLPGGVPASPAYSLKIEPLPTYVAS
jgi:alpha-L-fucosidase